MGNPEWEDADFIGTVHSEFTPDWREVDLRGFQRPPWFAQGSLSSCIYYLSDRRKDQNTSEEPNSLTRKRNSDSKEPPEKGQNLFRSIIGFIKGLIKRVYFFIMGILWSKHLPIITIFNSQYRQLALSFSRNFPDRLDKLLPSDISPYLGVIDKLRQLFEHYDIIHAYATDPILPLLSGAHPYIALEHGTIRSIPFEDTPQGRLTALSYRLADGVIITNCDNKRAADRLQLTNYRFIPHPVNENWMQPGIGQELRVNLLSELEADFILFHPVRQHWDSHRHPSWEKGNDILIEGMAHAVQEGINLAAIFVEWGKTVPESKALITKLGLAKRVMWIAPMNSANMARYIDASDLLADQFFLGAFGSILPRALALGKPAMIYIDEDIHRWCFPEIPPVINAQNPEQVFLGLKHAYEDQEWLRRMGERGRRWYQSYHSNKVIRNRLIEFYNDVLDN